MCFGINKLLLKFSTTSTAVFGGISVMTCYALQGFPGHQSFCPVL